MIEDEINYFSSGRVKEFEMSMSQFIVEKSDEFWRIYHQKDYVMKASCFIKPEASKKRLVINAPLWQKVQGSKLAISCE